MCGIIITLEKSSFFHLQLNYCNYCYLCAPPVVFCALIHPRIEFCMSIYLEVSDFFYAGIAILVESFGFSSGVLGYVRRGLIDSKTAFSFALASMPAALLASKYLSLPELSLKTLYSLLMIGLSAYLLQQSTLIEEEDNSLNLTSTNFSNGKDDSLLTGSTGE